MHLWRPLALSHLSACSVYLQRRTDSVSMYNCTSVDGFCPLLVQHFVVAEMLSFKYYCTCAPSHLPINSFNAVLLCIPAVRLFQYSQINDNISWCLFEILNKSVTLCSFYSLVDLAGMFMRKRLFCSLKFNIQITLLLNETLYVI